MHIKDHSAAMKFFRTYDNVASKGKWKEFVDEMEFDSMLQEPRTTAHEPRNMAHGGRIGFKKRGFVAGSGPGTGSALEADVNIKKVKSSLNKIKKQRNKKLMFEWSEDSDWYRKLQKDLGGKKPLNREYTNKLINQTVDEFFPNAYHGKNAIKNFRNDMVVNSFVEHLKTVGEFDGYEKTAKILEQFEGVGGHRYENINKSWKSWIAGEFEVDGVDRAKLKKELKARGLSYDQIDNWSASSAQKRGVNKVKELKWLDNQNIKHSGRSVDDVMKRFKEAFPDSNFYLRANELTSLKNTGKYISGSGSSRGIVGIEAGNRSKWLKDGFGVQFKGNYSKMIKEADNLEAIGKIDEATRLRKGANDFFGPDGLITKAKGEGEHALGRSFDVSNVDHQLKINSLVSGDLNQFKKWNFDIPVQRYFNEYNLAGTTKTRKKELAKLIEEHRTVLNYLTGGEKKGMAAKGVVNFRYGNTITASSNVPAIDTALKQGKFNVEDLIIKGKAYEDEFLKKGAQFGLVDKAGIKPEIMKSKTFKEIVNNSKKGGALLTHEMLNKSKKFKNLKICKTEFSGGGGGLCGKKFADADPQAYLEKVMKDQRLVRYLQSKEGLTAAKSFLSKVPKVGYWANPLTLGGGEAWYSVLEGINEYSKGASLGEAVNEGLWFIPGKHSRSLNELLGPKTKGKLGRNLPVIPNEVRSQFDLLTQLGDLINQEGKLSGQLAMQQYETGRLEDVKAKSLWEERFAPEKAFAPEKSAEDIKLDYENMKGDIQWSKDIITPQIEERLKNVGVEGQDIFEKWQTADPTGQSYPALQERIKDFIVNQYNRGKGWERADKYSGAVWNAIKRGWQGPQHLLGFQLRDEPGLWEKQQELDYQKLTGQLEDQSITKENIPPELIENFLSEFPEYNYIFEGASGGRAGYMGGGITGIRRPNAVAPDSEGIMSLKKKK